MIFLKNFERAVIPKWRNKIVFCLAFKSLREMKERTAKQRTFVTTKQSG